VRNGGVPISKEKENKMYSKIGIDEEVENLVNETEKEINNILADIDKKCEINSAKVINAFQKNKVSEVHFNATTGYGYDDIGRECVEKIFSDVLGAEDSLVRTQIVSGTHALTIALFAFLRPRDTMLCITGKPYDTLETVIGLEENQSSLKAFGINYEQIDLIKNEFDEKKIINRVSKNDIKLIHIQRSRGYDLRESITIEKLKDIILKIRKVNKDVIIMIDNCYCEFVETISPLEIGADIIVGSLIKNLGGGIATTGGYIAGNKKLVELAGERLTSPGQGKEVGPTGGANRMFLQGIYLAPHVVSSSLKTAVLASRILEKLGYKVSPKYNDNRADIVQTIEFGNEKDMINYCRGIQFGSAINSDCAPEPADMPGYTDKIIMASGSFTQGSSIELSCDGPIRPPYIAFMQGGLTYEYGKIGVMKAIQEIKNSK
jgi:cystathionine beta-lyase family protein involved in aluminum resistance